MVFNGSKYNPKCIDAAKLNPNAQAFNFGMCSGKRFPEVTNIEQRKTERQKSGRTQRLSVATMVFESEAYDLLSFLRYIRLQKYADALSKNNVTLSKLLEMTDTELEAAGVHAQGARSRLQKAAARFKEQKRLCIGEPCLPKQRQKNGLSPSMTPTSWLPVTPPPSDGERFCMNGEDDDEFDDYPTSHNRWNSSIFKPSNMNRILGAFASDYPFIFVDMTLPDNLERESDEDAEENIGVLQETSLIAESVLRNVLRDEKEEKASIGRSLASCTSGEARSLEIPKHGLRYPSQKSALATITPQSSPDLSEHHRGLLNVTSNGRFSKIISPPLKHPQPSKTPFETISANGQPSFPFYNVWNGPGLINYLIVK